MKLQKKRLHRPIHGQVVSGVIIGFAKYFQIDVTLLRVVFVFFVLITGFFPGVAGYIIAAIIMPQSNIIDPEDVIIK